MAAKHKNGPGKGSSGGSDMQGPHEQPLINILLRTGNWRDLFTEQACMMIVAEALNECVVNRIFTLAGYLLTGQSVFLTIYPKGAEAESILFSFYDSVRRAIARSIEEGRYTGEQKGGGRDPLLITEMLRHPFHRQYGTNSFLEKLVTGRRVNLPYDSLYLDRLKVKVRQSTFCSAIEYRGGEGPVIIEKLRKTLH